LAQANDITILPRPRVFGVPHYRDTPVHVLTRLSTKPTNQYRYLQLRQRTLYPVLPVHTRKEYATFKQIIDNPQFRKTGTTHAPHEHWKNIDFQKLAKAWNLLVNLQPHTITESNQRLYYKIPLQLEVYHKKSILWASERSTLADGSNFAALKPFLSIINAKDNYANVLPAISLPDGELDLSIAGLCQQSFLFHYAN
jgi:hypothetical protein